MLKEHCAPAGWGPSHVSAQIRFEFEQNAVRDRLVREAAMQRLAAREGSKLGQLVDRSAAEAKIEISAAFPALRRTGFDIGPHTTKCRSGKHRRQIGSRQLTDRQVAVVRIGQARELREKVKSPPREVTDMNAKGSFCEFRVRCPNDGCRSAASISSRSRTASGGSAD